MPVQSKIVPQKTLAQQIGRRAEDLALRFLQGKGLKLLERNYSCKLGELDLVMRQKAEIVFVEVRCRKSSFFGTGVETVGWGKQRKVILAAEYYLKRFSRPFSVPCRFDVVGVVLSPQRIEWIQNAFQVE